MQPFTLVDVSKPNKLQKILKKTPSINIIEELNNILARKSFDNLTSEDIELISNKYNVNLQKKFGKELLQILEKYIKYHFSKPIPNEGTKFLSDFVKVLGLNENVLNSALENVGLEIYKKRYQEIVSDKILTDDEESELDKLADYLNLSKESKEKISADVRRNVVTSFFSNIVEDGEISPDEYTELYEMAENLKVSLDYTDEVKSQIGMMQKVWEINHGELPVCQVPIQLQKNEICYFFTNANWYEYRSARQSTPYHGVTGRIKLGKGLYYRYGKINYQNETKEELKLIDIGDFYITNKRIIFTGSKGNKNLRYSRILGIEPFSNGVNINKDSGRIPFIEVKKDIEIFTAIFSRALNDNVK
jgi:hypothetical protein